MIPSALSSPPWCSTWRRTQKLGFEAMVTSVIAGFALAVALGVGAALLVRFLFTRDLMPEPLKTPVLLALAWGSTCWATSVSARPG